MLFCSHTEETQEEQQTTPEVISLPSSDTYGEYLLVFSLAVPNCMLCKGLRQRRPLAYMKTQMETVTQEEMDSLPASAEPLCECSEWHTICTWHVCRTFSV